MQTEISGIVEHIWGGDLEQRALDDMSPLSKILCCLLERPVVGLTARSGLERPLAMLENDEVLGGTTLGDILDEELGLFVEEGALVVVEPLEFASASEYSGRELGDALGSLLVELFGCSLDDAAQDLNGNRADELLYQIARTRTFSGRRNAMASGTGTPKQNAGGRQDSAFLI